MKVIVGLGNPGEKYKNTRHNIGFCVVDTIILKSKVKSQKSKFDKKYNAEIHEMDISGGKVLLVKPQTFMNNSGESVQKILHFYKIEERDLVVIHDDVDLPLGTIKINLGEGAAGHKGVGSIISAIGSQNFWRVRVGILNRPKEEIDTEKFVLENFSVSESDLINKVVEKTILEIKDILRQGIEPKKFSVNQRTDNENKD